MKKAYITAALPYVNGSPHIGHGLEYVQFDFLIRYYREILGNENVYSVTGSDENSLKNVRAAEDAGEEVSSFVERHAAEFKGLEDILDLTFDDFIRTREDRHMKGARKLWSACKPDDIYKKIYKGLYCVGCETFYTEKEVPDGICPEHKKPLEEIEEENYFFKLSNYSDQLEKLIESDTLRIVPDSRKNEVLSFIRGGLEDFSISRSVERAKHWGVSVPGDESQVMYVWFDALSNYITALGYAEDSDLYKKFWVENDFRTHVIGKGILRFHAVYWPAMLLSASLQLPHELFVHGYITVEGEKMSKSIGNVIHPKTLVDEYGSDAVRYYFLREIPSLGDGDYSSHRMEDRYAELANQLGNLVSRVAIMSNKYFEGNLDDFKIDWTETEKRLEDAIHEYNLKEYTDIVFESVAKANEICDKKAPFKLVKTDEAAAKEVLSELAEIIRFVGKKLVPIIPQASKEITRRYGTIIKVGEPLFPRRDTKNQQV